MENNMKDNIKELLHEYSKIPMWEDNEKRESFWCFFIVILLVFFTIVMSGIIISIVFEIFFNQAFDFRMLFWTPVFMPLVFLYIEFGLVYFIYDKYFESKSNKDIKKRMEHIEDQLRGETYSGSLKILNDEFILSGHGYSLDSIKDIITKNNGLPFVYILKGINAYKRENAKKAEIDSARENKIALLNANTITKRNNDFLKDI